MVSYTLRWTVFGVHATHEIPKARDVTASHVTPKSTGLLSSLGASFPREMNYAREMRDSRSWISHRTKRTKWRCGCISLITSNEGLPGLGCTNTCALYITNVSLTLIANAGFTIPNTYPTVIFLGYVYLESLGNVRLI